MSPAPGPAAPESSGSAAHRSLTIQDALTRGRELLSSRSGPDAKREAEFLLAGLLELAPGELVLQRDRVLSDGLSAEFEARLSRRAAGEPLQYIEGRAAFREITLRVDRSVLIPRPETEQLVEQVLEWARGRQAARAVDLGTGSGAIAISLALEGGFETVVGVDISADALNVARTNAAEVGVSTRVDLRLGSLFGALRPGERFDVVVSNPPYVARGDAESLPEEVREWEPALALYAGATGLEVIEEIIDGAGEWLESGGLLALEVTPDVAESALERARAIGSYAEARVLKDLACHRRILLAENKQ
jgi:release factor glutamine methyltransferase